MPSTVIRAFCYRPASAELDVLFTTGRRYIFREVPPEAAQKLRGAFNKGRQFNRAIRGRFRFHEADPEDFEAERKGKEAN